MKRKRKKKKNKENNKCGRVYHSLSLPGEDPGRECAPPIRRDPRCMGSFLVGSTRQMDKGQMDKGQLGKGQLDKG